MMRVLITVMIIVILLPLVYRSSSLHRSSKIITTDRSIIDSRIIITPSPVTLEENNKNNTTTINYPSTSTSSITTSTTRFGIRVNANNLTKQAFDSYYDGKVPVVITDVFAFNRQEWIDRLVCNLGDCEVEYDQRLYSGGDGLCEDSGDGVDDELNRYEATLKDFMDCVAGNNSDHYDNIYMMDESILNRDPELLKPLDLSSSHLYKGGDDASDTGFDLFAHFPSKIRPSMALIIGRRMMMIDVDGCCWM